MSATVPREALRAWRHRGLDDAFAHRPSAVETARSRHGELAAIAYLQGWKMGAFRRRSIEEAKR